MKYFVRFFMIAFSVLFIPFFGYSQNTEPQLKQWNAKWIAAPNDDGMGYGVYYFRKNLDLAQSPSTFIVHVSADNRYKLYINDSLVSLGPARSDLHYWNFETVDLAPYLRSGKNTIAALVWNEAQYRPESQITLRTGFILQGNSAKEEIINTDKTWKCIRDNAYQPLWGYFAASTGQNVDMNKAVMGWEKQNFNDSAWSNAAELFDGKLKGAGDGFGWMLVPSILPQMERTYQRIPVLREAKGIKVPAGFPAMKTPVTIPAHSTIELLLDQTYETNAFITLLFSRGKNANISIGYAESLFDNIAKYGMRKSDRNIVAGKDFSGRTDELISNGKTDQSFTTLRFRTFRYIHIVIKTKEEPLVLNDFYGTFTGFPFKQKAVFHSVKDNKEIQDILNIGWRTARLNAFETYTDCPYYEQLQYIGDTRIQAMVSYYYTGDDRLARNALNLMDHSRLSEGVTLSRYPTHSTQIIPPFSLWYIGMLHDYWMYRDDPQFIKTKLIGAREVLDFFSNYQQKDGSLKNVPYWNFVDWANGKGWFFGNSPIGSDGSSAILDLQLLLAYQWMTQMESKMGEPVFAAIYQKKANQLKQTIQHKYWDAERGLYADVVDKSAFSQHTNALAILAGLVNEAELHALGEKLLTDSSLTQCTIYFKYYLNRALVKAGLGNDYLNWLGVWKNDIKMGLTTWAEISDIYTTRSDCHAWGSSPNIEFFRTVLGIDSDAPGFGKIKIAPHLGILTNVSGEIPHPNGKVAVSYKLENGKWKISIQIPQKTSGIFIWKNKKYTLKAGSNAFLL